MVSLPFLFKLFMRLYNFLYSNESGGSIFNYMLVAHFWWGLVFKGLITPFELKNVPNQHIIGKID